MAVRLVGERDGRAGIGFAGHVSKRESGRGAEIAREEFAGLAVEVGKDDAAAIGNQKAGGGGSEAGRCAGDEKDAILDLHRCALRDA